MITMRLLDITLRFLPATALALAAANAAAAQSGPDSVSLRFGWPVGTTARVRQGWVRVQRSPQRNDSIGVRSTYRLTLLDHPDGRLVRIDSFAVLPDTLGAAPTAAQRTVRPQLLAQLGALQPSYIVSRDGEFRRVEDIAPLKRFVDSLFASALRELGDVPNEAKAMLRAAVSEQALTASAAQEWDAMVATWAGADWVIGKAYAAAVEEPIPAIPGLKMPMRYGFSAAERVPCTETARQQACVRLEMYSEPDSAALRKAVGDIMTRVGTAEKDILQSLENMRTEGTVTVIADPKTLLPYKVTRVKLVEVRTSDSGHEKGGVTSRVDTRTAWYSYSR
jgi:hypothetical protein